MPRYRHEPNPRNRRAVNRWAARVIPVLLAGAVGYCTYVIVSPLCIDYLLHKQHHRSAVIPILVIYFLLLGLWLSSFLRLWYMVTFKPPYPPLGPEAPLARQTRRQKVKDTIAGGEYVGRDIEKQHNDPDSPGLERFYTRDVFIAEQDGRPKWCSSCANWKPDRTHHCSDIGRCVYKMDHYCPWVGGPVGENNFKFFIQFTGYTALTCTHLVVVMAIYVHKQIVTEGSKHINNNFIAVIVLASFFGLFTASMSFTSGNLAAQNLTQVERINRKTKIYTLAVYKPPSIRINSQDPSYHEITYPLLIPDQSGGSEKLLDPRKLPPEGSEDTQVADEPIEHSTPSREAASSFSSTTTTATSHSHSIPNPVSNPQTFTHPPINSHSQPTTTLARDNLATRTFAILQTPPGTNPWDLGSYLANWKTIMGDRVIDWFLPIKRSPCCRHESGEGWFEFGPAVEELKIRVGLLDGERNWGDEEGRRVRERGEKKRRRKRRRHRRRSSSERGEDVEMDAVGAGGEATHGDNREVGER